MAWAFTASSSNFIMIYLPLFAVAFHLLTAIQVMAPHLPVPIVLPKSSFLLKYMFNLTLCSLSFNYL
jgi:hypothetical protein